MKVKKFLPIFFISFIILIIVIVSYLLDASFLNSSKKKVVITEIATSNDFQFVDEYGGSSPWLEIYNNSEESISLLGYSIIISDQEGWVFPEISIDPGEFLVIWASGKNERVNSEELFADFTFQHKPFNLKLITADGGLASKVDVPKLPLNSSFGVRKGSFSEFCHYAVPTPGVENVKNCFKGTDLGKPEISHSSGFYQEPQLVSFKKSDRKQTLIYTIDGTFPSLETNPESTKIYSEPFLIDGPSKRNPNLSLIQTTSYKLPAVAESRLYYGVPPRGDIELDFATPIRVRSIDGIESVSILFIGNELIRNTLPVISLVLDPRYLFDHESGVYVSGKNFDEWALDQQQKGVNLSEIEPWQASANYRERGLAWERPNLDFLNSITFDFCEVNGECVYQTNVGLRVHGNISRSYSQKSLRLYARKRYGNASFEHNFFKNSELSRQDRFILRNSGDDNNKLFFKDGFLQSLVSELQIESQGYRPSVLFINGEYWGIHNIRDYYDEKFLSNKYNLNEKNITILDVSEYESPSTIQAFEEWKIFIQEIEKLSKASSEFEAYVAGQIDINSFFDFLIVNIFFANEDSIWNNAKWWRYSTDNPDPNVVLHDGKWRWMVFDLDRSAFNPEINLMTTRLSERDSLMPLDTLHILFNATMENPKLRTIFISRFTDHLNFTFDESRVLAELDLLVQMLEPEIPAHKARWTKLYEWYDNIENLKEFLSLRPNWQLAHLQNRFTLKDPVKISISANSTKSSLYLNSFQISSDEDAFFEAYYFPDQLLDLFAETQNGYEFLYWSGLPEETKFINPTKITVTNDLNIYPIFKESN